METVIGRVVKYDHIEIHTRNGFNQPVKQPYINMALRTSDGIYELLVPADSAVQNNLPVDSLILAKVTFIALTIGTNGMYKMHSYRKYNTD